jgi:hypothetical protein
MGLHSGSRYHKEKQALRKEKADAKRTQRLERRRAKRDSGVNGVESVEQHDDINQQR